MTLLHCHPPIRGSVDNLASHAFYSLDDVLGRFRRGQDIDEIARDLGIPRRAAEEALREAFQRIGR